MLRFCRARDVCLSSLLFVFRYYTDLPVYRAVWPPNLVAIFRWECSGHIFKLFLQLGSTHPLKVPDFLVQFGVSGDDRNWKYEALGWGLIVLCEMPKCIQWPEPRPSKMMTPGEFPFWWLDWWYAREMHFALMRECRASCIVKISVLCFARRAWCALQPAVSSTVGFICQ